MFMYINTRRAGKNKSFMKICVLYALAICVPDENKAIRPLLRLIFIRRPRAENKKNKARCERRGPSHDASQQKVRKQLHKLLHVRVIKTHKQTLLHLMKEDKIKTRV